MMEIVADFMKTSAWEKKTFNKTQIIVKKQFIFPETCELTKHYYFKKVIRRIFVWFKTTDLHDRQMYKIELLNVLKGNLSGLEFDEG